LAQLGKEIEIMAQLGFHSQGPGGFYQVMVLAMPEQ